MVYIPSEEELESRGSGNFTLLPEDNYLVEVKELTIKDQPNPYDNGKVRPVALVKLSVISFENGEPLYDVDGNDTDDRLFFDFLEIEKLGMKPRPSKARKFITSCFQQPVGDAIRFDSWDELVGKRLVAHAIIKKNGKNGIDEYRPVRQRRRPAGAAPAPVSLPGETLAAAPREPLDEDNSIDLTAKAAEIFGEDAEF